MDAGFPKLKFDSTSSPTQWGEMHGESYKNSIRELVEIRMGLLREKSPKLVGSKLDELCGLSWEATGKQLPLQFEELQGIRRGSGLTVSEIVVLNAYTDIRDLTVLDDQGCSTFFRYVDEKNILCGQTWDMHSSAKNYLCLFEIPEYRVNGITYPRQIIFSLLGTLALMGYNARGEMLGVNNLNALNAKSSVIWPAMVRHLMNTDGLAKRKQEIEKITLTSARCFLLGDKREGAQVWEIFPHKAILQNESYIPSLTPMFHTNHCLDSESKKYEAVHSQASTTHDRYARVTELSGSVKDIASLKSLFQSHEGYPKSVCSHFQNGTQDPSHTCGGTVANLASGQMLFWRGCPVYETSIYKEHSYADLI
jgi:isopenicillin-N N-acyltransferase-like protein